MGTADPRKTIVPPSQYIPVKHREAIADYHYCCAVVTRFRKGAIPTLGATLIATLRSDLIPQLSQHNLHFILYITSLSYRIIQHIILYHTISYQISYSISYHIISYIIYNIIYIMLNHILTHRIISNHIIISSYISCHTIPYHNIYIMPYHIS